jgi:hypothetical protein
MLPGCQRDLLIDLLLPVTILSPSNAFLGRDLALPIPRGAVLNNPVHQCTLKANIVPGFFTFDPFVSKDLTSFGQEFLIQG